MAVTSVRFNEKEEKVLTYLVKYFNSDASHVLKKSLFDLYEDLKDKEIVQSFEKKSKKAKFVTAEDILK